MNELTVKIAEMLKTAKVPKGRHHIKPFWGIKVLRGARKRVVGYSWSRLGSHFANGIVYDVVLGSGDTYDAALENAYKRQK